VTIGNLGASITGNAALNKRCRVYNQDGSLSFDFNTITNDLAGTITVDPNDLTAASSYTYSRSAFTLKCNGITTPSATNTADFIVSHKSGSDVIVTGNKTGVVLGLTGATAPTNVVLAVSLALK